MAEFASLNDSINQESFLPTLLNMWVCKISLFSVLKSVLLKWYFCPQGQQETTFVFGILNFLDTSSCPNSFPHLHVHTMNVPSHSLQK